MNVSSSILNPCLIIKLFFLSMFSCLSILQASHPSFVKLNGDQDALLNDCMDLKNGQYIEKKEEFVIDEADFLSLERVYQPGKPFLIDIRAINYYARDYFAGCLALKEEKVNDEGKFLRLHDGSELYYHIVKKEQAPPCPIQPVFNSFQEGLILVKEKLPTSNILSFSYDREQRLILVRLQNSLEEKTLSWIKFDYVSQGQTLEVKCSTSDGKILNYIFKINEQGYDLKEIRGSFCVPIQYHFEHRTLTKTYPNGQKDIYDFDEKNRVIKFARPCLSSEEFLTCYQINYEKNQRVVQDAKGFKTIFTFDQSNLIQIEKYDHQGKLILCEKKFWHPNFPELLSTKIIEDSFRKVQRMDCYTYDLLGNKIKECSYGNLSERKNHDLQISSEGELLNSTDFEGDPVVYEYQYEPKVSLIKRIQGNESIVYVLQPETNLLLKHLCYEGDRLSQRIFYDYQEGKICKTQEDDGLSLDEQNLQGVTKRYVEECREEIDPSNGQKKQIILQWDNVLNAETKPRQQIYTYDKQGNLLNFESFEEDFYYSYRRKYNSWNLMTNEEDSYGFQTLISYDQSGRISSIEHPHIESKLNYEYDLCNNMIKMTEHSCGQTRQILQDFDLANRIIHYKTDDDVEIFYTYDVYGNICKVQSKFGANQDWLISQHMYDCLGNLLE